MADQPPKADAATPADAASQSRLRAVMTGLRTAAVVHWQRTIAFLVVVVLFMAGISFAWTFTVRLAINGEREKLKLALKALDENHLEQARNIVRQVLNSGALPQSEFGTPLFVLGAVKVYDADNDVAADQRRTQYLVASRYLDEARSYGLPADREKQGLLLLGKSLVATQQNDEGIDVLQSALEARPKADSPLNVAAHRLLAEAYTQLAKPEYKLALEHLQFVLDDQALSPEQRVAATVLESKVLARLGRYDEALKSIAELPPAAAKQPLVLMTRGQLLLDSVAAALDELPIQADGSLPPQLVSSVDEAIELLREAQSLDAHTSEVTRRSNYLMGRGAQLCGDEREALKLYTRTHQQHGDTPEGLAAKLAEADLLRESGDDRTALLWYRQILQSDVAPTTYRSEVLPIEQLRVRILAAVADFVRDGHYAHAISMLDSFPPLFSRTQELELRGKTLRQWGELELRQANDDSPHSEELRRSGLYRLREAGMSYEKLAALRFATNNYPEDLWNSADCYYLGHNYTESARLLQKYLQFEPEKRNAQALLRYGQVCLALDRIDECVMALEECIELYDRDNATYQARIDCARAYWYRGNPTEAERLLRVNLDGTLLEPRSPEWKDSLFALGQLLFDQSRFEEAIGILEEAVERYPNDQQALLARYVTGEAYRRWAEEPLERIATARTASEREKNEQLYRERLTLGLAQFKAVQSSISLKDHNLQDDGPYSAMRRNCYMLEGACLFDLGRYQDAIEAYQNVSSLYPNEPFVLETFVQIANCWQRLDRAENAHGAIQQAQLTLEQLPSTADFAATTAFSREEWRMLLKNMSQW